MIIIYVYVVYYVIENMLTTKAMPTSLDSGIKFLGLINKNGRLVNSIKKEDFVLSEKTGEILFMSIRLQSSMQNDFTDQFGNVFKIIIEHEKSNLLLYPLESFVIVAITEKNMDESKLKQIVMSNLNFLTNNTQIKENECQQ